MAGYRRARATIYRAVSQRPFRSLLEDVPPEEPEPTPVTTEEAVADSAVVLDATGPNDGNDDLPEADSEVVQSDDPASVPDNGHTEGPSVVVLAYGSSLDAANVRAVLARAASALAAAADEISEPGSDRGQEGDYPVVVVVTHPGSTVS